MIRSLRPVLLVALGLLASPVRAENNHEGVLVFTASYLPPITAVDRADRVFYLDEADKALQGLRFVNPHNEEEARAKATALLQTPRGKDAISSIQRAGEGIAMAWRHGITKLPAVLAGGDQVVYGVFDVGVAISLIQEKGRYVP